MDTVTLTASFEDILDIFQHRGIPEWASYEDYEEEEAWEAEDEEVHEDEGSHASEEEDILQDYMQQFEAKMKQEHVAKVEQKKEQLRSLIGMTKKKDLSEETVLTPAELESIPPEEILSEDSVHPCLRTVDISDSRLKIANLYTMHSIPDDPGLIQAYRALNPRRRSYDDDGADRFYDTAEKMRIPAIHGMREMLNSKRVDLRYYGVNPKLVKAICEALEGNTSVHLLNLKDNWLSVDACYFLNKLLLKNYTLTELNLAGCRIGGLGAAKLQEGISMNTAVTDLDLSYCNLRKEGLASITSAVCANKKLKYLNLRSNALNETCSDALQQLVSCSPTLEKLDLSWNFLYKPEIWRAIVKNLVQSILTDLDLSWNALGSECVSYVSQFIARSSSIERLNLGGNRFSDDDAVPLSRALSRSKVLQELYLGNNAIRAEGIFTLVQGINSQKSADNPLRILDLTNSWARKNVIPELEAIKVIKPWLNIRLGGILSNYKAGAPNARQILFKRAIYEAMKPKNKKQRKDFGQFVLSLQHEPISKGKFKELVEAFRLKLSDSLVNEIMNVFPAPKGRVDLHLLKTVYLKEYPDTKLLPEKVVAVKKQKKDKEKGKKEKKEKKDKKERKQKKEKKKKEKKEKSDETGEKDKEGKKPKKKAKK